MATSDIDVSVRVTVIQVLSTIDSQGLLEEEQRETLCLLVFDTEPRVRKAVSGFVKGVWEEAVEEKLVGRRGGDKELDQQRAGVKCLATLLLKWSRLLEKRVNAEAADTQDDESESKPQEIADLVDAAGNISSASAVKGRIGLCVEALWGEVDAVKEWTALLDHLLLDHTSDLSVQAGVASPAKRRAKRGVKAAKAKGKDNDDDEDDDRVEEIWRLDEREESLLIEVLLASLKKVRIEGAAKKKVRQPGFRGFTVLTAVSLGRRGSYRGRHDSRTHQRTPQTFRQKQDR
jgi:cohesin complex subunit SA-1/2